MHRTKRLRGPCQHCGALLEYQAELVGTTSQCPHCGKSTELLLETPAQDSGIPKRMVGWMIIAVLILVGGLLGAIYALNKTKSFIRERKAPATQPATNATGQ